MDDRMFVVERLLDYLLVDIIELRKIVSGLYTPGLGAQSDTFMQYNEVLEKKLNTYTSLSIILREKPDELIAL